MSASQPEAPPKTDLRELPVALIDPNERNPRLVFPQDELDRLAESIDQEGVLVPIAVYAEGDRFVLVDGERRFRCAQMLGLDTIPAIVTPKRPEGEVLVQMFNIHLIREPWRDIPTAIALSRLVDEIQRETGGDPVDDKTLRDKTGLSIERVRQLRYVMTLPKEWQDYIDDGTIPLNYFWELKRAVEALAKQRPVVAEDLGGVDALLGAFVNKRLDGVITDTVGLRKLRPIINYAMADAGGDPEAPSFLDDSLRELITNPDLSIDEVYEDTVQIMVEANKLERRTRAMLASFDRLLHRARSDEERDFVRNIGNAFVKELNKLLKAK